MRDSYCEDAGSGSDEGIVKEMETRDGIAQTPLLRFGVDLLYKKSK